MVTTGAEAIEVTGGGLGQGIRHAFSVLVFEVGVKHLFAERLFVWGLTTNERSCHSAERLFEASTRPVPLDRPTRIARPNRSTNPFDHPSHEEQT